MIMDRAAARETLGIPEEARLLVHFGEIRPYKNMPGLTSAFQGIRGSVSTSAGLPVVGSGLPSTLAYAEGGVYHHIGAGAEEFLAACAAVLAWSGSAGRRRELARGAEWNARFGTMLDAALGSARRGCSGM
jgi:hypothetical protein